MSPIVALGHDQPISASHGRSALRPERSGRRASLTLASVTTRSGSADPGYRLVDGLLGGDFLDDDALWPSPGSVVIDPIADGPAVVDVWLREGLHADVIRRRSLGSSQNGWTTSFVTGGMKRSARSRQSGRASRPRPGSGRSPWLAQVPALLGATADKSHRTGPMADRRRRSATRRSPSYRLSRPAAPP